MRLSKLGLKIIEEANNLKRTKKALAEELSISTSDLENVIFGKCTPKEAQNVISKMLKKYPIDAGKLQINNKDLFSPCTIFKKSDSKKSSRVFKRKNSFGKTKNYYEYRDTAMQKNVPIYPEWIKPLVVVKDNNPRNKLVCYNKGHLLHQFTFFIGEVNFYWKDSLGYHCKEMNTGDSNYIPPFIPHSFTSRNQNQLGLIIAVTFADILSYSKINFSHYKRKKIENFSGSGSLKLSYFKLFIRDYLNKNFLDVSALLETMKNYGINKKTACKIIEGQKNPNNLELDALSKILGISINDLKDICKNIPSEVFNKNFSLESARKICLEKALFKVWDLAKSDYTDLLKAFIMEVNSKTREYKINHQMHEYVYNFSEQEIIVKVEGNKYILKSEESIIFPPMVKHSFHSNLKNKNIKILIVRVPEEFSQNFIHMFAGLPSASRKKIFLDVSQWF